MNLTYFTICIASCFKSGLIQKNLPSSPTHLYNNHQKYRHERPGNRPNKKGIKRYPGVSSFPIKPQRIINNYVKLDNRDVDTTLEKASSGPSINSKGKKSYKNSVLRASTEGNLPALQDLLKEGADFRVTNPLGQNPLHLAIRYNQSLKMIKWLIYNTKIPIESQDIFHNTPFLNAAEKGNIPVLKLLKEKGANPHATTWDGENALHLAINSQQRHEVIKWLLNKAGIPIESRGFFGKTPYHYATMLGNIPVLELLIKEGANTLATDENGHNALWYADTFFKKDTVQFLKKYENQQNKIFNPWFWLVSKIGIYT